MRISTNDIDKTILSPLVVPSSESHAVKLFLITIFLDKEIKNINWLINASIPNNMGRVLTILTSTIGNIFLSLPVPMEYKIVLQS